MRLLRRIAFAWLLISLSVGGPGCGGGGCGGGGGGGANPPPPAAPATPPIGLQPGAPPIALDPGGGGAIGDFDQNVGVAEPGAGLRPPVIVNDDPPPRPLPGGGGSPDPNLIACTADYNPVCGSDGKTYSNSCNAFRAGITVYTNGPCPGEKTKVSTGPQIIIPGLTPTATVGGK